MYLAVGATIVGQALLLGRSILLLYAAAFAVVVLAFVRGYEEPTLAPPVRRRVRGLPPCGAGLVAAASALARLAPRSPNRYVPHVETGEFAELQQRLRALWPSVTLRSIGDVERTVVVVHSISMDVPDQLIPVFPAYEERFLCLVLSLLRSRNSRVVYVTSQPILPRLIDYYFGLVPELDTPEARSRFAVVSLVDGRNLPLTKKLLGAARARSSGSGRSSPSRSSPSCSRSPPRRTRSSSPSASGSRSTAPIPRSSGWGRRPAAGASSPTRASRTRAASTSPASATCCGPCASCAAATAILKLDRGVSGLGNALVDVPPALDEGALGRALSLEDTEAAVGDYLAALADQGGIVEERIEGEDFRSPSAQLRISPSGQVDILSTHDQVLGGPNGQTYFGCRFPADPEYAPQIAVEALKVGRRLAREGVIGRCAVDFVAVRQDGGWELYAIEINLRCGGTTHPFMAISTLTDGIYDPLAGEFRTRLGDLKHYVATDHLDAPAYQALTPDDLLDVVSERSLGWDAERETGVALHMVSALAVAGRIGLTAIGDTPDRGERALPRAEADARRAGGEGRRDRHSRPAASSTRRPSRFASA